MGTFARRVRSRVATEPNSDPIERDAAELLDIGCLRLLIDAAPVAVFGYGIHSGRLSYVNAKFADTLGYTVEQILALPSVLDIIADDQRDVIAEMIRRRESGDDGLTRSVIKVRHRDGTLLDAEVHGAVADVAGGGRIVIGVAVDVTQQVAASRQLREREEYFRAISDHLSDIIAILSRDHVVTYLSASVEHVLGFHRDEQIGRIFPDAFPLHPDDRARLSAALNELSSSDRFAPVECRFQHENGRWRTFEIAGTNLLGNEQIRGFLIDLHDVTDRKRMEQELAQLSRLTSLGRLAAQIAHEFNNVLMGIQPSVEVIRRRAGDDPAVLRFTDLISSSIARGKRITSDILRFGRPAQLTLRPVAVQELLHQVAGEIRPSLPQGIALDLVAGREPLFVRADPAQLVQVLVNLALNAKDAMRDGGGTLAISVCRAEEGDIVNAGRFAHFEVSDTGSGIAAEDLPYIFEPLFTTKKSGTGLGLSVVLQIVAAHGGHIGVDSEAGRGTTFHLFIPCASPPESAPETERSEPSPQSLRVLVVEDEEPVASGLRWMLEDEGFAVRVVGKGADVLPAISEFVPDLVVLDLGLPDEDGQTVYERIAAATDLPVIFSSGHATEGEIEKLVDPSRTAFLMKPYSTDELLRAMQRLVAKKPADE